MKKNQIALFCFSFLINASWYRTSQAEANRTRVVGRDDQIVHVNVGVGVVLDMETWQGRVIQRCMEMALSDFYCLHKSHKASIVFQVRDSRGDPFRALSAAFNLLEDTRVRAILWAQESLMEAKILEEFGEKNQIPVISFSTPRYSFPISTRSHNFLFQVRNDQASQVKGIAALIELHNWRNVIIIYQENDSHYLHNHDDTIAFMDAFFEEKNIHISFKSSFSASFEDDQIIDQLHELKTLQTTVFIVHLSHSLASRIFLHARRLGMISKGYAWIVTSKSMNHFNSSDSSTIESMQGVIGFRSYIPPSKELQNFSSRLKRMLHADHQAPDGMQTMQLNLGLLAYDIAWCLAKAVERVLVKIPSTSKLDARSNSLNLDIYGTFSSSLMLLEEIMRSNFTGLGGEFRFINGNLISNPFEIVNVIRNGKKRVGFCTSTGRIRREICELNHRRQLNNLESIIWPGGSSTIPEGRMLLTSGKILRIGVPVTKGFQELVKVKRNPYTNATTVSGFCIDVFKAALEGVNYQLQYEFIPFMDANGDAAGNYNDLVYQVYLKKFDAVVGDTTITASRSLYVEFTMAYTEIGVGIVALPENKDMWITFKPLQLWLSIVGFHILIRFFLWLIELQTPSKIAQEGQDLQPKRSGFYAILVGQWEQLRNKWATFIATISVFVLFIVSSCYTATLSSMMTVQHIELNSKGSYIGYLGNSNITKGVFINNINFENYHLKPFKTTAEYANALSKGSKHGGVSAILDEMPYIKIFLVEYSGKFSLVKTLPTTNGFAFVFPKGSLLVPDISREIARLRETGRLDMLENAWLKGQTSLTTGNNANDVRALTHTNFGGLFLISGGLVVVAYLIFQLTWLFQNRQNVKVKVVSWKQHVQHAILGRNKNVQSTRIQPQVGNVST